MARRKKSPRPLVDLEPPTQEHLRILRVISRIPRGKLMTYGQVGLAAGLPRRARLVGRLLSSSPLAEGVPWHRVVNAAGRISERDGEGPSRQRRLLAAEGVLPDEKGRFDLVRQVSRTKA